MITKQTKIVFKFFLNDFIIISDSLIATVTLMTETLLIKIMTIIGGMQLNRSIKQRK